VVFLGHGNVAFLFVENGTPLKHEAIAIGVYLCAAGGVLGGPLLEHGFVDESADASSGSACACINDSLIDDFLAHEFQGGEDAAERDGCGALDIVIEAGNAFPISLEDFECDVLMEILPLDDGLGEDF
jgi:hypothetical protein